MRVALAFGAALAFVLASCVARAQVQTNESLHPRRAARQAVGREPPGSRVGLGLMLIGNDLELSIDGRDAAPEESHLIRFGGVASFDQRVTRSFSLGIAGRLESGDSDRSAALDYRRWYIEADLVPRLRGLLGSGHPLVDGYVALPFGLTWPHSSNRWERAVYEHWEFRTGFNYGLAAGIELWGKHTGAYLEAGYFVHVFSARVRYLPASAPEAAVEERHEYVNHQLALTLGGLLGS